jgi:truncated hemoglobin YjbI
MAKMHRVRKHHWKEGILSVIDEWFETMEEALNHANSSDAHSVKVFNPLGEVAHSIIPSVAVNTYA